MLRSVRLVVTEEMGGQKGTDLAEGRVRLHFGDYVHQRHKKYELIKETATVRTPIYSMCRTNDDGKIKVVGFRCYGLKEQIRTATDLLESWLTTQ